MKRAKPMAVGCVIYLFIWGEMFPLVVFASRNAGANAGDSSWKYRKYAKDFDHISIVDKVK